MKIALRGKQQQLCFDNERMAALNETARTEALEALAELLLAAARVQNAQADKGGGAR